MAASRQAPRPAGSGFHSLGAWRWTSCGWCGTARASAMSPPPRPRSTAWTGSRSTSATPTCRSPPPVRSRRGRSADGSTGIATTSTSSGSRRTARARQTLALALGDAESAVPVTADERLRDRELGVLDLLTRSGSRACTPRRRSAGSHLGKFYHRPPGGESWADVALRLRSFLRDGLDAAGPPRAARGARRDRDAAALHPAADARGGAPGLRCRAHGAQRVGHAPRANDGRAGTSWTSPT